MLKVHVAERLAIAAGLVPSGRPVRRSVSLGVVGAVLAAVVMLVGLYSGVREFARLGSPEVVSVEEISRIAPAAGSPMHKLMSIEDMERVAGQD